MDFPRPRSRVRIWSRETGSAVPSRVSLLILHSQAASGEYSRPSFRFPRRRHSPFMKPPYAIGLSRASNLLRLNKGCPAPSLRYFPSRYANCFCCFRTVHPLIRRWSARPWRIKIAGHYCKSKRLVITAVSRQFRATRRIEASTATNMIKMERNEG